ncbi:hypothetical protein FPV67DRAFT_1385718, partial [Lyophyllum atratum]
KEFVKSHGLRKAFFKGHNSSNRTHIRFHFDLYKQRCEAIGVPLNHRCIPRAVWKEMQ